MSVYSIFMLPSLTNTNRFSPVPLDPAEYVNAAILLHTSHVIFQASKFIRGPNVSLYFCLRVAPTYLSYQVRCLCRGCDQVSSSIFALESAKSIVRNALNAECGSLVATLHGTLQGTRANELGVQGGSALRSLMWALWSL